MSRNAIHKASHDLAVQDCHVTSGCRLVEKKFGPVVDNHKRVGFVEMGRCHFTRDEMDACGLAASGRSVHENSTTLVSTTTVAQGG